MMILLIDLPQLVIVKILKQLLYERQYLNEFANCWSVVTSKENFLNLLLTNKRFYSVYNCSRDYIMKNYTKMKQLFVPKLFENGQLLDLRQMPKKIWNTELHKISKCVKLRSFTKNIARFDLPRHCDIVTDLIIKPNKGKNLILKEVSFLIGGIIMHKWTNMGMCNVEKRLELNLPVANVRYQCVTIKIDHNSHECADPFSVSFTSVILPCKLRHVLASYYALSKYVFVSMSLTAGPSRNFLKEYPNFDVDGVLQSKF